MWLAVVLVSLAVGLALQPILIHWLRQRELMDVPNQRSSHTEPTPRGGGLALMIAFGAGLLVAQVGAEGWLLFAGCLVLSAIGLTDDFVGVDAKVRLLSLLLVGAVAGPLLAPQLPLVFAVLAMALWTAAYVNAFNFMDGINGISALSAGVAGAAYIGMGRSFDSASLVVLGAAILGAALSFLPFNLFKARVFLGDVGSYGLGFAIAGCAWIAWTAGTPLLLALSPTLVYLADTGATLLRRTRAHAPLLEAHREHTYQRLASAGRSHTQVAVLVGVSSSGVVFLAWMGTRDGQLGPLAALVGISAVIGTYLAAGSRARRSGVDV